MFRNNEVNLTYLCCQMATCCDQGKIIPELLMLNLPRYYVGGAEKLFKFVTAMNVRY